MKFSTVFVAAACLASTAWAAVPQDVSEAKGILPRASCGAEGTCKGTKLSKLCDNRCKQCSGPSGTYSSGSCCGFGWQACCCYY